MSKKLSLRGQLEQEIGSLCREVTMTQTRVRALLAKVSGKQKTWLPWKGCALIEGASVELIRATHSLEAAANILGPMNSPHGKDVDPRKKDR